MKRSYMVERLVFYILETSGHNDATDFAEGILDWLEDQGMQPPACIKEKPLTPNMPIYDRHGKVTYKAQVNEWEPEND